MSRVAVIGSGIGGLSAAALLAKSGHQVDVFEASECVGGKAGETTVDGVAFDTGPSVLTLPGVFDELFERCGASFADRVQLRELSPGFRYLWPDGTVLDVHHDPERTLAEVAGVLGSEAESDLRGYLSYAARIWEVASPRFVFGPALELRTLLHIPPWELLGLGSVDPLRTMAGGIAARVRSPHLRDLLARYATYNGSDPRRAPATLNCIAHVELSLGGYGVEGGIAALVQALVELVQRAGGRIHTATPIQKLVLDSGRVSAVQTPDDVVDVDAVVCNADVAHLAQTLLPESRSRVPQGAPSTSGWTAVVRSSAPPMAPHVVGFPDPYDQEFADLFDRSRPPQNPTVYACDQTLAHGRPAWPDGSRPVFLMANAPAEPEAGSSSPGQWISLRERVLTRATDLGLIEAHDAVVWERSPTDLAALYPGSRGALYGVASNSTFSAFRRAPNRIRALPGLYLASGSAHPGGGLPLCAMSGQLAADALLEDLHAGR